VFDQAQHLLRSKKTKEKVVPFTVNRNVTEGGGGRRKKQQQKSSVVLGYYL
jgi:hypothetical protein